MTVYSRRYSLAATIIEWRQRSRRQRIQRIRNALEHDAAIIIQRNCHNWLWAPICRDGTMGLMVRRNMMEAMDLLL